MGLDMYLKGKKYIKPDYEGKKAVQLEDGFPVQQRVLELGYWRKHPNLHGFIVQKFANGKDECQEIEKEALESIINATKKGLLPETQGFFFGQSSKEHDEPTLEIIQKALKWMNTPDDDCYRYVVYRASW